MGGSASYRLAKKIANARLNGAPQSEIDELERQRQTAKEAERQKRLSAKSTSPYQGTYSQERLDKALWTDDRQTVDERLRPSTGEWWQGLTYDEKSGVSGYTGSSFRDINKYLGGRQYEISGDKNTVIRRINNITSALDKSSLADDIWLRRGVSDTHLLRLFGLNGANLDIDGFRNAVRNSIANEKIVDCKNFMSCSGTSESGYSGDFEMKIFAPQGTKGAYAEPFSAFGMGDKSSWDGKEKQTLFGSEFEVILQRGTKLRPIAYNEGAGQGGKDQIVFVIVGQDYSPVS